MGKSPVVDLGGDGLTEATAAFSCRALYDWMAFNHWAFTGIYWLKPGERRPRPGYDWPFSPHPQSNFLLGTTAVRTYCDFTNDDGGWTLLVLSVSSHWNPNDILHLGEWSSYAAGENFLTLRFRVSSEPNAYHGV